MIHSVKQKQMLQLWVPAWGPLLRVTPPLSEMFTVISDIKATKPHKTPMAIKVQF